MYTDGSTELRIDWLVLTIACWVVVAGLLISSLLTLSSFKRLKEPTEIGEASNGAFAQKPANGGTAGNTAGGSVGGSAVTARFDFSFSEQRFDVPVHLLGKLSPNVLYARVGLEGDM